MGRSSRRAGTVPLRPDLPVGDWSALPACCFRLSGRPMSYVLSAWAEPWRGSRSLRDPGFMNPTPFIGEVEGDVFLISYSGASIYKKMSLGAINGPARFVFTKMPSKATNGRQIYIILQTSKLCNRIKSTRPNS